MDWKSIVKTVAPGIATALGGPLAGMGVKAIAGALLGPDSVEGATEDMVAQAVLAASPADLVKLKEVEADFQQNMKALDVDLVRISSEDRQSARDRQVKTGDQMPAYIAFASLSGFFGILVAMIFVELPPASEAPLNVMLGALGALVVAIGNYYFGSSAGSSAKNAMIANLLGDRR